VVGDGQVDRSHVAAVDREVGHRHLAGGDERGPAREQAEQDQQAAEELDDAADAHLGGELHLVAAERAEELLGAVAEEGVAGDDPQDGVERFTELAEEFVHLKPPESGDRIEDCAVPIRGFTGSTEPLRCEAEACRVTVNTGSF
jgi:hypothetical protein